MDDGADIPSSKRRRRRRRRSFGQKPTQAGQDQLTLCFGPDRAKLRKALRTQSPEASASLIHASRQRVTDRIQSLPQPTYPSTLPFTESLDEIRDSLRSNQVTILCGETGSGKSTQLPKLCLEIQRGTLGLIGHTQPRRLAARSVADRVAEELGYKLGNEIGYKVRFGDHTSENTLIKLMTDGILLAETRSDRLLEQYDTIIIDEAHERSLNIDFLLGILTQIVPKRPDLKLIITSATIDAERFADHFSAVLDRPVPVLEISGRTHPVEIVYRPIAADRDDPDQTIPEAIADAVEELSMFDPPGDPGGILVFLPGEREIREAAHELRQRFETDPTHRHTEVLPLYARLSPADQHRIFSVRRGRRIVLATNVAETSLTVPGIRHVIDTGVARISRYSSRRKIQSLQIEPISQASARQRAGRCGRTEPGICIRLYSQADHDAREAFTPPEIIRTNLAGVILQMRSLKLGDPERFPFLESPDRRRIHDAYDTLVELNAIDHERSLTKIGSVLARLPVDPRIGRILVAAAEEGVLAEGLVIASFLEIRDPRDRPADKRDAADAKHAKWNDKTSDFLGILNLWRYHHAQKESLSRSQLRRACQKDFLSYQRLREWTDTHRQLRDLCKQVGLPLKSNADDHDAIHRAIITGCLTNIGKRHQDGGFTAPRGGVFQIHPSSAVTLKGAKWIIAAELIRTTRLYARTVARINPRWIVQAADHLIKRDYTDPAFEPDRGRVEVSMTASLWDLEITKESRVDLSPIDRPLARRVFIEQALVERGYESGAEFERHNDALIEHIHRREAKLRCAHVPIASCLYRFFDHRLPPDVCTVRGFDRWRRREEQRDKALLHIGPGDMGLESIDDLNPDHYPDTFEIRPNTAVSLDYQLNPGQPNDGASISLPAELASTMNPDQSAWLIPGWLPEKIETILRGLPNTIRRQLDINSLIPKIVQDLDPRQGDLYRQLATSATRHSSVEISPKLVEQVPLPDHLQLRITLLDPDGKQVASSRDPNDILQTAREQARKLAKQSPERSAKYIQWPGHDLPETTHNTVGSATVERFQALVDAVDHVLIRQFDDRNTAKHEHHFGVRRLIQIDIQPEINRLLRHTPGIDQARTHWATVVGSPKVEAPIGALVAEWQGDLDSIRSEGELLATVRSARQDLASRVNAVVALVATIGQRHNQLRRALDQIKGHEFQPLLTDVKFQLSQLVHASTLHRVPLARLNHYPRYLEAVRLRLEGARGPGLRKDAEHMALIMPHWRRCLERAKAGQSAGRYEPPLDRYRWMIEEWRVSLFAQKLGTPERVSRKILEQIWTEVESLSRS